MKVDPIFTHMQRVCQLCKKSYNQVPSKFYDKEIIMVYKFGESDSTTILKRRYCIN